MKMARNPNLPKELMVEIFSRMPAKSVGKCRCLSKTWRHNLSTSQFIKLHLSRKNHQQSLILISKSHSLKTITFPIENNNVVSKKLELQEDTWTRFLGSCNGLVLLANKKMNLCLVNPLTTQKVCIPDFDLALKTRQNYSIHGFGYDTCTDDYKIVAIPGIDKYADVYSVRKGVWNRVYSCYSTVFYDDTCIGALFNGAFHCLAVTDDHEALILAFDFANEVFYEIPVPASDSGNHHALCVLGDRLCLVNMLMRGSNSTDVWIMEEYGSVESWAKLCTIDQSYYSGLVQPICFLRDDEILFRTICEKVWILYNVKEGTVNKLIVDGVPAHFMNGGIFFDSLVSLG